MLRFSVSVTLVAASAMGCETDLGPCDEAAARTVYFSATGEPSYGGQALVAEYCDSCHSVNATGAARRGVPAELDFDMALAESDMDLAAHLRTGQQNIFDWRSEALEWVEAQTMPPEGHPRSGSAYMDVDGNPLPGLDGSAGQDMMRNWLSCGSPVVEKSRAPSNGQMPGDTCTSGEVGDCRVSNETDPPQPTWTWLYENYFSTLECTACHETGGASQGTMILGTTSTMAYSAMVDAQTAADAMCSGQTIVVPGDADASNLVHKLEGQLPDGGAICGNRMPFGGRAPNAAVLQAVRDWIDAGAMNN